MPTVYKNNAFHDMIKFKRIITYLFFFHINQRFRFFAKIQRIKLLNFFVISFSKSFKSLLSILLDLFCRFHSTGYVKGTENLRIEVIFMQNYKTKIVFRNSKILHFLGVKSENYHKKYESTHACMQVTVKYY